MSKAEVVRLFSQPVNSVRLNDVTTFPYVDVAKFVTEAEKLRKNKKVSALYCAVLAASYNEPLAQNYADEFPAEHPWLTDPHQEMVAKRLARIFYRPSIPQIGEYAKMMKIEGIISSFRFDDPDHRLELMELFEAII